MALSQERHNELAKFLRIASSWVGGERELKILAWAHELEGASPEEAVTAANAQLASTPGAAVGVPVSTPQAASVAPEQDEDQAPSA